MAVTLGILALLEAKPGKGEDLGAFLESGRDLAAAEQGTVTWYAFKVNETTYGIFDTFETEDGAPSAHQRRRSRGARQVAAELLAKDPDIRPVDVVAVK